MGKVSNSADSELAELGWTYVKTLERSEKYVKKVYKKNKESFMLKLIQKKHIFSDRNLRRSVNKEIMIVNKVKGNFNFLVGFYEFFYTRTYAVFVYEHYEFGSIQKLFMSEKMSLLEVILLMRDLFNGLEELKHMKIIHKNLHPQCIFLSKNTLKIGGYEYCEMSSSTKMDEFDHNYLMNKVEHHFHTVPPEVLFNKMCGVKTPIFSFGVIFFKMLHQRNPTDNTILQHMINSYLSKEKVVDFRPDLPPEFAFILRNSLEITYEYRLSPYELKQELNYLCSFIRGKEEELRMAVFNRRRINGVELANFYEPGKDVANKVLVKKRGKQLKKNMLRVPTSGKNKVSKRNSIVLQEKDNQILSNLDEDNEQRLPKLSSSYLAGGPILKKTRERKYRQQRIKIKPFLPGIWRKPPWMKNLPDKKSLDEIYSLNNSTSVNHNYEEMDDFEEPSQVLSEIEKKEQQ